MSAFQNQNFRFFRRLLSVFLNSSNYMLRQFRTDSDLQMHILGTFFARGLSFLKNAKWAKMSKNVRDSNNHRNRSTWAMNAPYPPKWRQRVVFSSHRIYFWYADIRHICMRTTGTMQQNAAKTSYCSKMARGVARDIQNVVQTLASTHRQLHFGGYGVFVRRIDRSEVSGKNWSFFNLLNALFAAK